MRLRWSQRSLQDLRAIGDFIAQDNPGGARRWVARLQDRARRAAPVPYSGRKVPEVDREDIREVFLSSHRILYQIFPDHIEVLTVFEGHRLLPEDLRPKDSQEDG